jgi:hypothetical protein
MGKIIKNNYRRVNHDNRKRKRNQRRRKRKNSNTTGKENKHKGEYTSMGETIGPITSELDEAINTGNEKSGNGGNSSTEETANPRPKRGRPRKDEPTPGEEKKFPGMVNVEVPTPGEPKKTAPRKRTKAKKGQVLQGDHLESILKTVSEIISNRPGYEIWKLDEKEISQLAEPLANVLSRSSYLEKITDEYGDYVALCIAIGMIVIPRLIVQMKQNNEKRKEQKETKENGSVPGPGPGRNINTERNESTPIRRSDTRTIRENPHRNEIVNTQFHESIPVI